MFPLVLLRGDPRVQAGASRVVGRGASASSEWSRDVGRRATGSWLRYPGERAGGFDRERRRAAAIPKTPVPSRTKVPGSGTGEGEKTYSS
jgi:hypothetical protein